MLGRVQSGLRRDAGLNWPACAQEYCDSVRNLVRKALAGGPCDNMRLVCLAVEHERMHLETLMYMAVQQVRQHRPGAALHA